MSNLSPQAKRGLRDQIREALKGLSPEERAVGSSRICERLQTETVWQEAGAVLLFMPAVFEPDIRSLIDAALRSGKRVALPRYSAEQNFYVPCQVEKLSSDLQAGPFSILEPTLACRIFPANQLDFALVPGVGFALNGGRLGRGKGYYDRLLAGVRGFKCGVGFECQLLADIPLEPHDIRLNCILTPARWHLAATTPVLK
jgi:5-formyltetrahydrofolate cyclo-ligase